MLYRIARVIVVAGLLSVTSVAEVQASENPEEEGLSTSTVLAQAAGTAGVGVGPVALGTALASYEFVGPEASNVGWRILYGVGGTVGVGVLVLSTLAPPVTTNVVLRNSHDKTYLMGPYIGGLIAAIGGSFGSRAISANLWRTDRLDWQQRRWRTAFVVSLPVLAGMVVGGTAGYILEHRRRSGSPPVRAEAEAPAVAPTVGVPTGAEKTGWTVGASVRF